jgi:methionine biosynthesis protein MetW
MAVLKEALRVGRYVVASFPNFGHWKSRLQLLVTGKAPVTGSLPYQWYNTPNIHFLTIKDFRLFTHEQGIRIVRHFYVGTKRPLHFWPNLCAGYGVFVLEKLPPEQSAERPTGKLSVEHPPEED